MCLKSQIRTLSTQISIYAVVFCLVIIWPTEAMRADTSSNIDLAGVANGNLTTSYSAASNTTNMTATNNTIADFTRFNIAGNESVIVDQFAAGNRALFRVVGGQESWLNGSLTSNGILYFQNTAGIIFGNGANINVNQLIATSLNISNADFLTGNNNFAGGLGSVINRGNISAEKLALIGRQVANYGNISCPAGYVVIASGDRIYLGEPGSDILVQIDVPAVPDAEPLEGSAILNEGTVDVGSGTMIIAAAGDVYSQAITNVGTLSASSNTGDAGSVKLAAVDGTVVNSGTIEAAGDQGGQVTVEGKQVGQFGTVSVDGTAGDGGKVDLIAGNVVALSENSLTTANAGTNGDGGKITVFSPDTALFWPDAKIEAKGGSVSGDGGFVEVSGKQHVEIYGLIDAGATNGANGLFFIDPYNITIQSGVGTLLGAPFTPSGADATIQDLVIEALLVVGTSVTIQTADGAEPTNAGNIIQNGDAQINYVGGVGTPILTLNAANNIVLSGGISAAGAPLEVVLNANGAYGTASGTGAVTINAAIATNGGDLTVTGIDFDNTGGTIGTGGGKIDIQNTGNITIGAAMNAGAGDIDIDGGGGVATSIIDGGGTLTSSGTITLEASGNIGTVADPIETAAGTLNAATTVGGQISISEADAVTVSGLATTGENIRLVNEAAGAITTSGAIASNGGTITISAYDGITLGANLTSGAGIVTLDTDLNNGGAGSFTINNGVTLSTTDAAVDIIVGYSGDIILTGTGAINAGAGEVTIEPSGGTPTFELGSAVGTFNLTTAEIENITAATLTIGSATMGAITVGADISPDNVTNLHLITGSTVTATDGGISQVTRLGIEAGGAVTITDTTTEVDGLAIYTSTGDITYIDTDGFSVDTVDGLTGIDTDNGSVTLTTTTGTLSVLDTAAADDIAATTTIALTVTANEGKIEILSGADVQSTGGTHTYTADKMDIAGTITATGQKVILKAESAIDDDAINLGSAVDTTGNTLELSDTELDHITATTLQIGEAAQAGAITVSSDISPAAITNLHLINNSTVTATDGGIVVSGLAVEAAGAVEITDATTNVATLAIDTSTGNITFTDADSFSVGTVDSIAGVDTDGGSVALTATTGDITVTNTAAADDIGATTTIALTAVADEGKITINSGADVESTGGTHTYTADKMAIAGTITATGQKVILKAESAIDDDAINLGSTVDTTGNTLELSDAEIDNITATTLQIGEAGQAEAITVSADITPANVTNLHLITNSTVTATALSGGGIVVSGLAVEAAGAVEITEASTDVDTLAVDTSTGSIKYTDIDGFSVGTVDGVAAVDTDNGSVQLTAMSGDITVTNTAAADGDVVATTTIVLTAAANEGKITIEALADVESTGGAHTYIADKMDIAGTITATGQRVTLMAEHEFDDDAINLGAAVDTVDHTLALSDTELDNITATTLVIGETGQAGAITVSSDISPAAITNLHLINNSTVTATDGGIVVSGLAVEAAGAVTITDNTTDVTTLAVNTSSGNIQFTPTGAFTVGTIDGVDGVHTVAGNITLTATSPLTISADVTTTGDGDITLTAGDTVGTAGDAITISASVLIASDLGDILLTAGDDITQAAGGVIQTGGAGTITLIAGNEGAASNDDEIGSITQAGTAQIISGGGMITLTAGPDGVAGDLDPGADNDVTGGDIAITSINAGAGNVVVRANSFHAGSNAYGNITDVDAGTEMDITGGALTLTAAAGIGSTGTGGAIEIDGTTVTANNTTSGGIFLNAIGTGGDSITAHALVAGNIEIYGTEDVTLANVDTIGGTITVEVAGADVIVTDVSGSSTVDITTTGSGSVLTGANDGTADVTAVGTLTIASGLSIGTSGAVNFLEVDAPTLDLTSGNGGIYIEDLGAGGVGVTANAQTSGDIVMTSTEVVTLTNVDTASGAVTVTVTGAGAGVNAIIASDVLANGEATLTTVTNGDILVTDVDTLNNNDVTVNSAEDIVVAHIGAGTGKVALTATTGAASTITDATGVDTTVDVTAGEINLAATGGIGVSATNSLNLAVTTVVADVTGNDADIFLTNAPTLDATLDVSTSGTASSDITYSQTGGKNLDVLNATTVAGNITIGVTSGDLTATIITAGTDGNIDLSTTTSGNIRLGAVNAAADDVTLDSVGSILDNNAG
ncbi:MAG: filamentous hemagglutinin N-terminal domain-containing protein, partial [Phycisphaerae bacterium]